MCQQGANREFEAATVFVTRFVADSWQYEACQGRKGEAVKIGRLKDGELAAEIRCLRCTPSVPM